jgi:hypothetical protein
MWQIFARQGQYLAEHPSYEEVVRRRVLDDLVDVGVREELLVRRQAEEAAIRVEA